MADIVSLIVLSYNQRPRLEKCLLSLARQIGVAVEVVVVDDGSTDGSLDMLHIRDVTLVESTHTGNAAKLYNLGVRASKGNVVILLQGDFILSPDFCLRAAQALLHNPGKTVVVGVWRPLPYVPSMVETSQVLAWMGAAPRAAPSWGETRTLSHGCIPETLWMAAAHPLVAIKREHWIERDEAMPFVYTDWEWAYRLFLDGFAFSWCPLMQGFHQPHSR
ncbi:MAG: glycosyltransferase family A protein, partial [Dehalococcoidia bacterium]|nr:glycosyltransferase family A protein [Dehalococcoidia bacterium]